MDKLELCRDNKLAPINFDDFTAHYQNLIEAISIYADPLMKALLRSLLYSQNFVHFSTYGISHEFVGVLKVVSQKIAVRGIVSNIERDYAEELKKYTNENPRLRLVFFEKRDSWGEREPSPHQKLLIIDGLVAFKGAVNLTLNGWRNAQEGLDVAEIVTNVRRVREFHNRYFQPLWSSNKDEATGVEDVLINSQVEDEIPF